MIVHVVPADYGWLGFGRDELQGLDRSLQRQAAIGCALLPMKTSAKTCLRTWKRVGRAGRGNRLAARESNVFDHALDARPHWLGSVLIGSVADRVARLSALPGGSRTPGRAFADRKQKRPAVSRFKHEADTSR